MLVTEDFPDFLKEVTLDAWGVYFFFRVLGGGMNTVGVLGLSLLPREDFWGEGIGLAG